MKAAKKKAMNYEELSERLAVSKSTLRAMKCRGQIPREAIIDLGGRLVRFDAERVEEWIAECQGLGREVSRSRKRRKG